MEFKPWKERIFTGPMYLGCGLFMGMLGVLLGILGERMEKQALWQIIFFGATGIIGLIFFVFAKHKAKRE